MKNAPKTTNRAAVLSMPQPPLLSKLVQYYALKDGVLVWRERISFLKRAGSSALETAQNAIQWVGQIWDSEKKKVFRIAGMVCACAVVLASCGESASDSKDFKLCKKAAEQGDAGAQFELGECYMKGKGVKKDTAEAAMWFRAAAKQGHKKAAEMLNEL